MLYYSNEKINRHEAKNVNSHKGMAERQVLMNKKNPIKYNAYDIRELIGHGQRKFNENVVLSIAGQYTKKIMRSKANGNIFNVIDCNNQLIDWISSNTTKFRFFIDDIGILNAKIKSQYGLHEWHLDKNGKLID